MIQRTATNNVFIQEGQNILVHTPQNPNTLPHNIITQRYQHTKTLHPDNSDQPQETIQGTTQTRLYLKRQKHHDTFVYYSTCEGFKRIHLSSMNEIPEHQIRPAFCAGMGISWDHRNSCWFPTYYCAGWWYVPMVQEYLI